jgi:hypothetical protein
MRSKLYAEEIKREFEQDLRRLQGELRRIEAEIAEWFAEDEKRNSHHRYDYSNYIGDMGDLRATHDLLETDIEGIEEQLRQHATDGCFYWPALHG